MMSINSLRPNPYRPLSQSQPLQPKFGTQPGGDGDDPQKGTPSLLTDDKEALQGLLNYLQQERNSLDPFIKAVTAALGITQGSSSNPVPASAETPVSGEEAEDVRALPGKAAGRVCQETQAFPKYTPRSERNRLNVGWDITKEYMGSNKVLWDMGIGVAVGAVCAIGSPVMAVTIPTTMMVIGGIRLMLLTAKMFKNPQGNGIDKMYQKWMKADAEQAKKAAGRSS